MRSKAAACVAVMLMAGFLTSALAYTEAPPKLPEPWAGYDGYGERIWQG